MLQGDCEAAFTIGWATLTLVATMCAVWLPRTRGRLAFCLLVLTIGFGSHLWVLPLVGRESANGSPLVSSSMPAEGRAAGCQVHSADRFNHEVHFNGKPVFILKDGYLARFRFTPSDDHWLGTRRHPVNLGWSPVRFPAVKVGDVSVKANAHGFAAKVVGSKPDWPGVRFATTVTGQAADTNRPLRYTIRSELVIGDCADFDKLLGRGKIEYLDIWIEGIFWPVRDGHDRELYEDFLFGEADGSLHSAPKLHVFPSLRKAAYQTLVRTMSEGGFIGLIDSVESGILVRIKELSSPGKVGVCWWTWDPHLTMKVRPGAARLVYEVEFEGLPVAKGRALSARAQPIPFQGDIEYKVPIFTRGQVNTFKKLLDSSDEWTWEPHSARCLLDDQVGYDDKRSVTIRGDAAGRTAWYTRAVGVDYFDHRTLNGGYRVAAMVRTRNVVGSTRIGIVCYNGPETWLYGEPDPITAYSPEIRGTNDWAPVEIWFDATGYKRFKIVLEQNGSGQSWFDNVSLTSDPSAAGVFRETGVLDMTDSLIPGKVHLLNLRNFDTSHPRMLADARSLTLAWRDCSARSRPLHLAAGRYRFIVKAKGEGCRDDPPVLLAEVAGVTSEHIAVAPNSVSHYELAFELPSDKVVRLMLTFTNDGVCRHGENEIDKNVFIESVAVSLSEPPSPGGSKGHGSS